MQSSKPHPLEYVARGYCYVLILLSLIRSFFLFQLPLVATLSILRIETSLSAVMWWLPGALLGFFLVDALALLALAGIVRSRSTANASFRDLLVLGVGTSVAVGLLVLELFIPQSVTLQ